MDDTTSTVLFTALARSGDYLTSSPPMALRSSAIKIAIARLGDDHSVEQVTILQTTIVENPEHFAATVIAADYTAEEAESHINLPSAPFSDEPKEETYLVTCAGDSAIIEGPDSNYRKLLNNVGEHSDYNGGTDLSVVVLFEGTTEQLAILKQIRISGWVDDPENYDDEDDDEEEGDEEGEPLEPTFSPMVTGDEPNEFTIYP